MGHLPYVLWSTVTYARVHGLREVRGDLTVGKGRMPPLANNLHGDEADDRMQSTQLWLDAIHLGSKPSTEVMPIKERLITNVFSAYYVHPDSLWLEWMTFTSYSTL